jgi:hypothetical protein
VRLALLILATALAQVPASRMVIFGTSPDVAILVVMSLGLLGGVAGSVSVHHRAVDHCLLRPGCLRALDAGRRLRRRALPETSDGPRGVVRCWARFHRRRPGRLRGDQVGTGVDADVSDCIRDAAIKTLIGAALAIPVLLLVRLLVRPALVDDRRSARRPMAPRAAETGPTNP